MLVLSRKLNEQILIGDDIKITLVRIRGNCVRIGIDAPRDVRVIRGELDSNDSNAGDGEFQLSDREQVFAHPQAELTRLEKKATSQSRLPSVSQSDPADHAPPQLLVGRVGRGGENAELRQASISRAPLARFMSTT